MDRKKLTTHLGGVWSAAPTPFTEQMKIDRVAIRRMVQHHLHLKVNGLFLAGTNGEGPWLTEDARQDLVATVVKHTGGRMPVAVQVTDNSSDRILANIQAVKKAGADIAVIAPPYFMMNATPDNIRALYTEAIRKSPLPVGIYDKGRNGAVVVPDRVIEALYTERNVILVKDSSTDPKRRRIALAARRKRKGLALLNGNEFDCVTYLKAGYDGLLLGGGVFNGHLANQILDAVRAGDIELAERTQERMTRIMLAVYGGPMIKCWLAGEKKLLVDLGILRTWRNYPNYPLTKGCEKAIARVLKQDRDVLLP
jgi:4-hydroxy-tetrahydrodipicolinate synthase